MAGGRKILIALLISCSAMVSGQLLPGVAASSANACTPVDALAIWNFENNGNDEEGDYNLTAENSAGYTTSSPYYGTYCANLNTSSSANFYTTALPTDRTVITICGALSKGTYTSYPTIWDWMDSNAGVMVGVDAPNNRFRVATGNGTTTSYLYSSTLTLPTNTWYFLAIRLDLSTGTGSIYLNGSDVTGSGTVRTDVSFPSYFRIGSDTYAWWGKQDAIHIYDWWLSDSQLSDIQTNALNEQTDCL